MGYILFEIYEVLNWQKILQMNKGYVMIWKEFYRVPDFFLYLSNTVTILVVHGLRFQLRLTLSSIGFNCVESCSISSDELIDHQNSADI